MKSKILLACLAILGLLRFSVEGQTVSVPFTFSGTSPVVLQMDQYGNLSSLGTYGTGTFSLTGAGTRLFWYPGKGAFRAGVVDGTEWNDANIGAYSAAFGDDAIASSSGSFVAGLTDSASGYASSALGAFSNASGFVSMASGDSAGTGEYSAAFGASHAGGSFSAALGQSVALGNDSFAAGSSWCSGYGGVAFGYGTSSVSECDMVIGRYNIGAGTNTSWIATEPIFEIGNGTSGTALSDALIVYKNGNMAAQGTISAHATVRCAAGGDISMGSFTAGTAP